MYIYSIKKMTIVYDINEINNIRDNGFIFELSDSSIDVINHLSETVGAPTYIKTPIFPRREKKMSKKTVVDPNFKKTVLVNTEEEEFTKARGLLNKLTEKTYDKIFTELNSLVNSIVEKENNDKLNELGNFIFTNASSNRAFSNCYAKLYKQFIENYEIFKNILSLNLDNHIELFKNVETANPDENYELFCKFNELNERRRSLSLFISNLLNHDVIECDVILNIIEMLHNSIEEFILLENKGPSVLEIVENVSIIIQNSLNKLIKNDNWKNISNYVNVMRVRKNKQYVSLPSKSIFKYMDIYDKIKDLDK